MTVRDVSLCQQKSREGGSSRERGWRTSGLGGEGKAVCEEGPVVHRIKRREVAAERASAWREKLEGAEDHYSPNTPGVQFATSHVLAFSRISFAQDAGVGGLAAYFPYPKQSSQRSSIASNISRQ